MNISAVERLKDTLDAISKIEHCTAGLLDLQERLRSFHSVP